MNISMFGKVGTSRHPVPTSPFVHLRKSRHQSAPGADLRQSGADLETKSAPAKPLIAPVRVPTGADLPNIYALTRAHERKFLETRHQSAPDTRKATP